MRTGKVMLRGRFAAIDLSHKMNNHARERSSINYEVKWPETIITGKAICCVEISSHAKHVCTGVFSLKCLFLLSQRWHSGQPTRLEICRNLSHVRWKA
ncbi:hypothetical protein PoB_000169500 [Plakobranchus ocellatus]|uniref:Uncharacterized protein n=1 Tax=Plakobranchus ocellatus TaxID=259542 RepID=A0AAV3XXR3_9GAST|nr:hypothetical protein PoB_000169500 [Plakobranchus ocellatus]